MSPTPFVSSVQEEVSFALIDFRISTFRTNWIEKSGVPQPMNITESIRKCRRHHRPMARPRLFWLNRDSQFNEKIEMKLSRMYGTALIATTMLMLSSGLGMRGFAQTNSPQEAKNIGLVRGAWADGSCWSKVIALLQDAPKFFRLQRCPS